MAHYSYSDDNRTDTRNGASEYDLHPGFGMVLRVKRPGRHPEHVLVQALKATLGTDPACTVQVAGSEPLHCLLIRGPRYVVIRSWNHSFTVNDVPTELARLENGDRVGIGDVTIQVQELALQDHVSAEHVQEDRQSDNEPPQTACSVSKETSGESVNDNRRGLPLEGKAFDVAPFNPPEMLTRIADLESAIARFDREIAAHRAYEDTVSNQLQELIVHIDNVDEHCASEDEALRAAQSETGDQLSSLASHIQQLEARLHSLQSDFEASFQESVDEADARLHDPDPTATSASLNACDSAVIEADPLTDERETSVACLAATDAIQPSGEDPMQQLELQERRIWEEFQQSIAAAREQATPENLANSEETDADACNQDTSESLSDLERAVLEGGVEEDAEATSPHEAQGSVSLRQPDHPPTEDDDWDPTTLQLFPHGDDEDLPTEARVEAKAVQPDASAEMPSDESLAESTVAREEVEAEPRVLTAAAESGQPDPPVSAADVLARMGHATSLEEDQQEDQHEDQQVDRRQSGVANPPQKHATREMNSRHEDSISGTTGTGLTNSSVDDPMSGGLTRGGAYQPTAGESDDESIERYMENLLNRMRGSSRSEKSPSSEREAEPSHRAGVIEPQAVEELEEQGADEQPPEKLVARSKAPELNSNLAAMRKLANESTRAAIDTHTRRSWAESVHSRAGASAVGMALAVAATCFAWVYEHPVAYFPAMGVWGISIYWAVKAIKIHNELSQFNADRAEEATDA